MADAYSTGQLWDRRCLLQIGDRQWDSLRVVFRVERSLTKSPNRAEIAVYNLSPETIGRLNKPGQTVRLTAGYRETAEVIFSGDLQRIQVQRQGADVECQIIARDGGLAWQRAVSAGLSGSDLSLAGAVQRIATAMQLQVSQATRDALAGRRLRRATAMHGQASQSLDVLLRSAGYEWSIQDGALQVLQTGSALAERAVLLSTSTGLVDSPVQAERGSGWVATSLLQPKIRPGRTVRLQAERGSGDYRAVRVVHSGDTHNATPWNTEIELRPRGTQKAAQSTGGPST